MPRTRSVVNRRTSTTEKVEKKASPQIPKPSREKTAKVVKKAHSKKRKEAISGSIASQISIGSKVPLSDDFGGDIYLNDGTKTSLKQLLEKSSNGVIVYVYPKPLDENAAELYGEFEHAQLDWEAAEMNTIGVSRNSVSSTAAFVKEQEIRLPLLSNMDGSLMKAMSIVSPKGDLVQGGFILSKTRKLLVRTLGKNEKILDDLSRVVFGLIEERDEEAYE
ncbi:hypothetical protein V8C35DRAFT_294819 [Trichoderma chlorosporum]